MPGYVWCKCSVCSRHPAGSTRQISITAQRHTEQDEQRSQAQSSNAGPSQAVITGAGSLSDVSDIRIPTLGADAQIRVQNHSPISEHGGMQFESEPDDFDDNYDEGLVDDESDFDAEPRLDDQHPCTPDDLSSGEEDNDLGEGITADGDDIIDEQLFIP